MISSTCPWHNVPSATIRERRLVLSKKMVCWTDIVPWLVSSISVVRKVNCSAMVGIDLVDLEASQPAKVRKRKRKRRYVIFLFFVGWDWIQMLQKTFNCSILRIKKYNDHHVSRKISSHHPPLSYSLRSHCTTFFFCQHMCFFPNASFPSLLFHLETIYIYWRLIIKWKI